MPPKKKAPAPKKGKQGKTVKESSSSSSSSSSSERDTEQKPCAACEELRGDIAELRKAIAASKPCRGCVDLTATVTSLKDSLKSLGLQHSYDQLHLNSVEGDIAVLKQRTQQPPQVKFIAPSSPVLSDAERVWDAACRYFDIDGKTFSFHQASHIPLQWWFGAHPRRGLSTKIFDARFDSLARDPAIQTLRCFYDDDEGFEVPWEPDEVRLYMEIVALYLWFIDDVAVSLTLGFVVAVVMSYGDAVTWTDDRMRARSQDVYSPSWVSIHLASNGRPTGSTWVRGTYSRQTLAPLDDAPKPVTTATAALAKTTVAAASQTEPSSISLQPPEPPPPTAPPASASLPLAASSAAASRVVGTTAQQQAHPSNETPRTQTTTVVPTTEPATGIAVANAAAAPSSYVTRVGRDRGCFVCEQEGHLARDCPYKYNPVLQYPSQQVRRQPGRS